MTGQAPADPSGQQFKCPDCGGAMAYDAGVRALKCGFCPKTMAPPSVGPQVGAGPREIPLSQGFALAPKGLGTPVQSVNCKECGATVNLGPNDRTAACTYCASAMVMPVETDANLIRPESLVPFQVPKERATASFKEWLAGLWFRPNNLKSMARLEQIVGVYVPYWTFDCNVHSEWSAERGWYYYETEEYTTTENGQTTTQTRQVQRTRWESAYGWRQDHYDDVLVCGSKGLPEKLAGKFSTFNTTALVAYAPSYLAGWRAESYAIDLPNAWTRAQTRVDESQRGRCSGDVGGDTHRSLSVSNQFSGETFKHVLLPVYVAAYRYQNKPYRFLVNGQTGEVVGESPLSVWKIMLLVVTILVVAAIGYFIWQSQQQGSARREERVSAMMAANVGPAGAACVPSRTASVSMRLIGGNAPWGIRRDSSRERVFRT